MYKFIKLIILLMKLAMVLSADDPIKQKSIKFARDDFELTESTAISPEIVKEFKDFENLIPAATIDAIVAKHYVVDGNFRTALKYLRSQEFSRLQKELLDIKEIVDILEFLHLTDVNATTSHMGATKIMTIAKAKVSLNDNNDVNVDVVAAHAAEVDNGVDKMTTNTGTIISKRNGMVMENSKESSSSSLNKRPQQLQMAKKYNRIEAIDDKNDDDDVEARTTNEMQPLVHIVLLEDLKVKRKNILNEGRHHNHNHQHHYHHHQHKFQHHQRNNNYHHHNVDSSLGTFTTFVDEVLQHLPHSAYQNMINDKCKKNAKFAEFYKALRSPDFKPLVDQAMLTDNIKKVIRNLNSHDVDVKSLEPIIFKVISWGPDIKLNN